MKLEKQTPQFTKIQELVYELKVDQVMSRDVISVRRDTTMSEFRTILRDNRISGTPVVSGRRLIGLTVDDVVDLVTVAQDDLQDRAALPGVDPVLVRAVGRRGSGSYVVLDTAALFAPVLAS